MVLLTGFKFLILNDLDTLYAKQTKKHIGKKIEKQETSHTWPCLHYDILANLF